MQAAGLRGKSNVKASGKRIMKHYKKRVHSARKACRMGFHEDRGDAELAEYLLGHKGPTYLRLQDMPDEELIDEYLQYYPRIFEDADALNHAIDHAISELRSLGLPGELCSRISQLLREKVRRGERELLGDASGHSDKEDSGQAPESKGEFQRMTMR